MWSRNVLRTILIVTFVHVVLTGSAASQCSWTPGFWIRGLNDSVNSMAVYDDGNGAALYAGGSFTGAGSETFSYIAKWDGAAWSPLDGPSGTGTDGVVYSLAVYDDGSGAALYAGGLFSTAGGVAAHHIAKWDGSEWTAVDSGTDGNVLALAVFDDGSGAALYAGGDFATAGGLTVNGVARWNGTTWSALSGPSGTGVSPGRTVRALAVHDDGDGGALYAGGTFITAGGVTVNRIAKWDGTAWSALSGPSGTGVDSGLVFALASYDDGTGAALYAGGQFATVGGVSVENIAKWDGTAWSALSGPSGTGTDSTVRSLETFGGELYAGGSFTTAGGVAANRIAKWNGTVWSALSGSGTDATVFELRTFNDGSGTALYVGGSFHEAGEVMANFISRWTGTEWSAVGLDGPVGNAPNDSVYALATYDDGNGEALYAGGSFTVAGGVTVNHVAKWDGNAWSALAGPSGTGIDGLVHALAVYDDGMGAALYAAGTFTTAGGVTVNNIAKWNGVAWSALSGPSGIGVEDVSCTSRCARALAVWDDGTGAALYVGGGFSTAGGVTANHVARWDGTAWSDLSGPAGNGTDGTAFGGPWALTPYDDGGGEALYAAGYFPMAGGVMVNHAAKWDGSEWSALNGPSGIGLDTLAETAAVYDDGSGAALYVAGDFAAAGGLPANRIARWDGTEWSTLGGPPETFDFYISLAVYDDGNGPGLYGGGAFAQVDGVTVNNIARWDGTAWSALSGPDGTGASNFVISLAEYDDGSGPALFAGGLFTTAGGVLSTYLGKWSCFEVLFADGFESGDTTAWSGTVP